MNKELITQSINLFDSIEKWSSFVDLTNNKEQIKNLYFRKVKSHILKYFNENPIDKWACELWGDRNFDIKWYIQEFGSQSLSLCVGWRFEFHLRLEDVNMFDAGIQTELLKNEYAYLLSRFDRIDRQFETQTKAMECRNYYFNSPFDGNFDNSNLDIFAWYAGNYPELLAKQIIQKVENFRQDNKATQMLIDINTKSKKSYEKR